MQLAGLKEAVVEVQWECGDAGRLIWIMSYAIDPQHVLLWQLNHVEWLLLDNTLKQLPRRCRHLPFHIFFGGHIRYILARSRLSFDMSCPHG
jgi:hypothetical protein